MQEEIKYDYYIRGLMKESYFEIINAFEVVQGLGSGALFPDQSTEFIDYRVDRLTFMKINKNLNKVDSVRNNRIIVLLPLPDNIQMYDIHVIPNSTTMNLMDVKEMYLSKVMGLFDRTINTVSNLVYYEFGCLNNELANYGIFITNNNREEKYIEILETEDDDLVNILEKYLICKDEIERASAAYEIYKLFKSELNECDTEDEIKEKYGLTGKAIVTMKEVVEHLYNRPYNGKIYIDDEMKDAIDAYYEIYGVREEA